MSLKLRDSIYLILISTLALSACDDHSSSTQDVGGEAINMGGTMGAALIGGEQMDGSDLNPSTDSTVEGGSTQDFGMFDASPPCESGRPVRCLGPRHEVLCSEGQAEERIEACPLAMRCQEGSCQPVSCTSDAACLDDTFCLEGQCTPYPNEVRGSFNERCGLALQGRAFAPEIQCRWTGGEVSGQPLVIDLEGDGIPEVLVVVGGNVVAISGDTCEELRRSTGLLLGESSLAAGDIDADGEIEVVAMGGFGSVVALNHELITEWTAISRVFGIASAPAIADLDGDGAPEVIAGGTAFNGEDGTLHGQAVTEPPAHGFGPIPAIADFDEDGTQEVLYGHRILNAFMEDITPPLMQNLSAGHVAIANFDRATPEPELAVVSGVSTVRVQRLDGEIIFGPYPVPNSLWAGGAPNVADFDGDGQPEIGTAGSHNFAVFDLECQGDPLPSHCEAEGIRWTRSSQDGSSGSTGSTTFDFDGDSRVEVVYNDECFLRVYDGSTGEVLLALANSTGTLIEAPIVADVDGDGRSEIIVGSDQGFPCETPDPHTGAMPRQTQGIAIIRDASERWVRSRPIWNQNAYSITNVEHDGTIPIRPEPSWTRFNSFRQNLQPDGKAHEAPDLTALGAQLTRTECGPIRLTATLFNRGAQPVSPGLRYRFYEENMQNQTQMTICEGQSTTRLQPGDDEEVSCVWQQAPEEGSIVWIEVDPVVDPNLPAGGRAECVEENNRSSLFVPACIR